MKTESCIHSQVTLAGQVFNVSRDSHGQCFVGDEMAEAFVERMNLLGRDDIIADLAAIGRAKVDNTLMCDSPQQTAWALHQSRIRRN